MMPKAVVDVIETPGKKPRKKITCPRCGSQGKKLSQGEVFLRGEYPAPQIEVRECKGCGTLFERDKWIEDRLFWRGVA